MSSAVLKVASPELVLVGKPDDQFPVDARRLWSWLEVGRDFSTWIKGRIAEYAFIEGSDYSPDLGESTHRTKPGKSYQLTFDMAKELAMVERNERGREARRYFISCEAKLKSLVADKKHWHLARAEGKDARRVETDIIKAFIAYAKEQGSQSAEMYFMNFSRMVNSALLKFDGKAPVGLRDSLNSVQLHSLSVAESVIARMLVECMTQKMPYKETYKAVKEKVTALGLVVGQSRPGISTREYVGLIA